jgi:hypothetical protein
MRALTAQDILHVWERGQRQHPIDRALTLLAAASPGGTRAALAALSVGRRDAHLLELYESTFAGPLQCMDICPTCAVPVEFSASPAELLAAPRQDSEDAVPAEGERLDDGDVSVSFRLPTSLDLAAAARCGSADDARMLLLRRCVTSASRDGATVDADSLSERTIARVAAQMATRDPQAEIVLGLTCPECGHRWTSLLDIVEFFWTELTVQAYHILADVHTLASSYGWHETDIVAMSSTRRRFYLDMVGA